MYDLQYYGDRVGVASRRSLLARTQVRRAFHYRDGRFGARDPETVGMTHIAWRLAGLRTWTAGATGKTRM
jgi:hypothetical protein